MPAFIFIIISNQPEAQAQFGLYLGGGASKEGNSMFSTQYKPAFEADAVYNIDLKKYLDLRILAGYKLRGFRDQSTDFSGQPVESATINYHLLTVGPDLLFPVLEKKQKLYLLAGLRGNYLVSVTGSFAEEGTDPDEYTEMLDKIQLEAIAGIGWEIKSGLMLEAILSGNCLNKGNKNTTPDFRAYDLYFGLALGYVFL